MTGSSNLLATGGRKKEDPSFVPILEDSHPLPKALLRSPPQLSGQPSRFLLKSTLTLTRRAVGRDLCKGDTFGILLVDKGRDTFPFLY